MLCAVMILTGVGVTERTNAASRYVCNQCGKSLSSAHESHTRECGGQLVASKYYCSSCGQTLSDPGSHEHEELVDGITCSSCGGTGKQEIPIDCTTCNGTGMITSTRACPGCGGSGSVGDTVCSYCYGNGGDPASVCGGRYIVIRIAGYDSMGYPMETIKCDKCGDTAEVRTDTLPSVGSFYDYDRAPKRSCTYCSGKGYTSWKDCSDCHGSGSISSTTHCSKCNGQGYYYISSTCKACGGEGTTSEWVSEKCTGTPTASQYKCADCGYVYSSYGTGMCTNSVLCTGTGVLQDCTLSFNASVNGGSTAAASQTCDVGSSVPLAGKTASKTGWEFVGWNTNRNAKLGLSSVNADGDMTVYAIFKKDLTVKFVDC